MTHLSAPFGVYLRRLSSNRKSRFLTITVLFLTGLILGTMLLPSNYASHNLDNVATLQVSPQTVVRTGDVAATPLKDDPLIKFRDADGDGVRDATPAPGECVFYDANNDGVVDVGEAISGGTSCPGAGSVRDDPKLKYVDANNNDARDSIAPSGPEKVFYEANVVNSKLDPGEPLVGGTIPTATSTGTTVDQTFEVLDAQDVFAWAATVTFDPDVLYVSLILLGPYFDQAGEVDPTPGCQSGAGDTCLYSFFRTIDNPAGKATGSFAFLAGLGTDPQPLTCGATDTVDPPGTVADPCPTTLITIRWRVMKANAFTSIHILTKAEDFTSGSGIASASGHTLAEMFYNTEDSFYTNDASIVPPDAEYTATPSPIVNVNSPTVSFDATASVSATSYSWDFGDGSPAGSGQVTSHTYPALAPRDYRSVLTVSGPTAGTVSKATKIIIVTTAPVNPTTTTVNCSPPSVVVNEQTSCTATVADTSTTPSTPTGSVSFASNGAGLFSALSCTLAGTGDSASCSVNYTPSVVGSGTHTITGTYAGDDSHDGSSGMFNLTVNLRSTSTAVECSPSTVAVNQVSSCTATVTDTSPGTSITPGGTITFISTGAGSFYPTVSCTLSGTGASASCSVNYTPTAVGVGTHEITGNYDGDARHAISAGTFDLTVNRRATTTTVTCTPASVNVGVASSCTATVTDTSLDTTITPAGSVSWTSSGAGSFSATSCTLSGSGSSATCSVDYGASAIGTGTHTITGSYGGDSSHNISSGTFDLTVTTAELHPTRTSVFCDTSLGTVVNRAIQCLVTVDDISGAGATTPTGVVSFTSSGAGMFTDTSTGAPTSSCTLTGTTSRAICRVNYTPTAVGTGTHTITGDYGGDATHSTSSDSHDVTVSRRSTTTTVSCTPASVNVGQSSECTATVADISGSNAITPTGSVGWTSDGAGSFSATSCTLSGSGSSASCSVDYTPSAVGTGTHTITGSYGGDASHDTSSDTFDLTVTTVVLHPTSTSVNCTPSSVVVNEATSCTATVTDTSATGATTPTGSVSFTTSGTGTGATSCILSGTGVSASCNVGYTPTAVGTGTHTITGSYGGDEIHNPSSGTFDMEVSRRATATFFSFCTPASVNAGQVSTCEVTVSDQPGPPIMAITPSGSVSFTSSGSGTFSAPSCTLSGTGNTASCRVNYTPTAVGTGSHTITGTYGGDTTHETSSGTFNLSVGRRSTTTTVNCVPASVNVEVNSRCTATVTDTSPDPAITPTGTVDWTSDSAGSFSATSCTLSGTGTSASCFVDYTPSAVGGGMHTITGSYGGDSSHDISSDTFDVTVSAPTGNPPVAVDDSYSTDEDTTLIVNTPGVLGNDNDPNGDPITAVLASTTSDGSLTLDANGSFSYIPDPNFCGGDSFTYRANDGILNSNTATVSITVTCFNDAPVAVNDTYTTAEDTPLSVPLPGVLGNDSDVDGDALTAVLHTGPASGTLVLNSDGSFTYTPNLNFFGTDSFAYGAHDSLTFTEATVTITVTPVNDAPVAADDSYSTPEDTLLNVPAPGVLSNDSDVESASLTAVLVTGPSHGTLSLSPNGEFIYTPAANFFGADTFTYRASDGSLSDEATVNIIINAVNDAPVAVDDSYSTDQDTPLTVPAPGVLDNDSDVDSDLIAVLVIGPSSGTLTLNSDGSFTYTPNTGFTGTDSFNYRASDGTLSSDTASVNITVEGVPPTGRVFLSFDAFDADNFENGVGELDVLVNGQRVVNIPAGLNGLTGSGKYEPYDDVWVSFGPFDITGLVRDGTNTIVFDNPLDSHSSRIRNVRIIQGETVLLNEAKSHGVPEKLTFSIPALQLTSFTVSPSILFRGERRTFTASFDGGVGPFRCTFKFGDDSERSVTTSGQSCSTTHAYQSTGTFTATVRVRGVNTSDRITGSIILTVHPEPRYIGAGLTWTEELHSTIVQPFTAQVKNPSSLDLMVRVDFTVFMPDGRTDTFVSPSFLLLAGQSRTDLSFTYPLTGGTGEYCFIALLKYGVDTNNNGVLEDSEILGSRGARDGCFELDD